MAGYRKPEHGASRARRLIDLAWALINSHGVPLPALTSMTNESALSDMSMFIFQTRSDAPSALLGAAGLLLAQRPDSQRPARRRRSPAGKAKAVIQIWMWGGPAHLDTFDPKPEAGNDYCGPLNKPIPTNVDGIVIGELLPLLAKQADKYSIIRSMTHGVNAHETASYMVQTGRMPGDGQVYPCVGAVVSLFKGYDAGYKGLIPPYIVLTEPQGRFSEAGFLGSRYKPFATGGDPAQTPFAVEGVVAQGITDQRQQSRRELLAQAEHAGPRDARATRNWQRSEQCEKQAYDLILGDAGQGLRPVAGEGRAARAATAATPSASPA